MKTVEIKGKMYEEKQEPVRDLDQGISRCTGCAFHDTEEFECFETPECTGIIFVKAKEDTK